MVMTTDATPYANCYSEALSCPHLGQLSPGGLALNFGYVSRDEYRALWENRSRHKTVLTGACLTGLFLDGLELLQTPDLPHKSPQDYLIAAFVRVYKGDPDFHFSYSKPGHNTWLHSRRVQYGDGEAPFIVREEIARPHRMPEEGIFDYEFITFARVTAALSARLGLAPHPVR